MASVLSAGTTSNTALNLSADTTGILQLASNGSTTALTIDTSQNVGIGLTSPTSRLTVRTADGDGISIQNAAGTAYRWAVNADNSFACVNTGVAERMRIDSSGNVGIGTTNPNAGRLNVVNSSGNCGINIDGQSATGTGAFLRFRKGGVDTGFLGQLSALIGSGTSSDLTLYTEVGINQLFYTGGAERMRITAGGRLLLGTTTTTYPIYFKLSSDSGDWFAKFENTNADPYGLYLNYSVGTPNNASREFIYCADASAVRMYVYSNGGIANYSGNNVNLSDEREKTNIKLAGSYLDKICAIPVKTFNYIDQNREEDDGLTLGVIAQDVQKVAPELVLESNWANKDEPEKIRLSVYQTDLTFALMKAIQELKAELDATKAEVAALKGVN